MTTLRMTPKQKQVLEFIRSYSAERGFPPTQEEIARHFRFRSLGTVQNYLVRLERQGSLRRTWNAKRALELVEPEPRAIQLPMVGRVAAGKPIEPVTGGDTLEVPSWMVRGGETFVLRVAGDSMVGDGILDGDYIVVRRQETAESGQTVVALVDGHATVKRLQRRGGATALVPANPTMAPIPLRDGQDLRIEGVVVGVLRSCP